MTRLMNLEINQNALRPPFIRKQKDVTGWKERHQHEAKAPDSLKLVGVARIDESQWCSPYQEPHSKEECPRREEDSPDSMNFIDTIFTFRDENDNDEYVDITREQLVESKKNESREV
jgi:hypothetical protein